MGGGSTACSACLVAGVDTSMFSSSVSAFSAASTVSEAGSTACSASLLGGVITSMFLAALSAFLAAVIFYLTNITNDHNFLPYIYFKMDLKLLNQNKSFPQMTETSIEWVTFLHTYIFLNILIHILFKWKHCEREISTPGTLYVKII